MATSTTNWSHCMFGGVPGKNGHQVPADKMTKMQTGKVTVRICEDCKARKIDRRAPERKAK